MNAHREIWVAAHGSIPKGWIIHHLNGGKTDNRLENLAAVPRYENPEKLIAPYRVRIQNLERLLKQSEEK